MQYLTKHICEHIGVYRKIAVSLVILGALAFSMDLTQFFHSLDKINLDTWVLVVGICYLQILALSYRWQKLVNIFEHKISFGYAIKTNLVSLLANYLFITSVGGVIVRVAMNLEAGVSLIRSIAAAGTDRICTLLSLVIMAIVFMPFWHDIIPYSVSFHAILLFGSITFFIGILFVLYLPQLLQKFIFFNRKIALCMHYLRTIATRKTLVLQLTLSSLVAQIANFIAVYFIMHSMGIEFSFLEFLAVIPAITIISCLPIGYGGWGIREGAFVYGLGLIGVGFEDAFSASIQIGLISMAGALLFGLPAAITTDFKSILSLRIFKTKHDKS